MAKNRHDLSSVRAGVGKPGRRGVSQIMEPKVVQTGNATGGGKAVLEIGSWLLGLVVEKHVLGVTGLAVQPEQFPSRDSIHRNASAMTRFRLLALRVHHVN